MAVLAGNNPITSTGDYDVATIPGQEYLASFSSDDAFVLFLSYLDQGQNAYRSINNGEVPFADGTTECRLIAPSSSIRINCASITSGNPVYVTFVPVK